MGLVALIASHIMQGMKVTFPAEERIIPVAGEADSRAFNRFKPVKTDGMFDLTFRPHVGTSRPMAPFASPLLTGNLECPDSVMNGLPIVFEHIIMANGTFFRADIRRAGYAFERAGGRCGMRYMPRSGTRPRQKHPRYMRNAGARLKNNCGAASANVSMIFLNYALTYCPTHI